MIRICERLSTAPESDDIDPPSDTDLGIALTEIKYEWGRILPRLILAESESAFDEIWADFREYKQEHGIDDILAYQQQQADRNKVKLGL